MKGGRKRTLHGHGGRYGGHGHGHGDPPEGAVADAGGAGRLDPGHPTHGGALLREGLGVLPRLAGRLHLEGREEIL